MNYYQFHIGDYRGATAHLSNEEDLCYRRLLDMYYDSESPIPVETQWVARRLRVGLEVLESVLRDFFLLREDGWHNAKADTVLREYLAQAEKNRENGKKGGRPKSQKSRVKTQNNPVGSQVVTSGNPVATTWKGNQEPITINHKPETNSLLTETKTVAAAPVRASRNSQLPDDWAPTDQHRELAEAERKDLAREAANFRDYHSARGNTMKNWNMAFNTWLRNSFNTSNNRPQQHDHRAEKRSREFLEQPSSARIWDDL